MPSITQISLPLLQQIEKIKAVSPELKEAIIKNLRIEKIKAGTVMLAEGAICTNLWFLSDGLFRAYHYINEKEITSRIMFSGHIVIAPGSFFTQTPSTESIEALTESIVAILPYTALQKIYQNFPEFNYQTRIITEQYFYKQEQRLYLLRKHNALSKYKYFLENYASFLQAIPQKYIASFLNISPETLSRTRSRLSKMK